MYVNYKCRFSSKSTFIILSHYRIFKNFAIENNGQNCIFTNPKILPPSQNESIYNYRVPAFVTRESTTSLIKSQKDDVLDIDTISMQMFYHYFLKLYIYKNIKNITI